MVSLSGFALSQILIGVEYLVNTLKSFSKFSSSGGWLLLIIAALPHGIRHAYVSVRTTPGIAPLADCILSPEVDGLCGARSDT
jgi:hypothetical protein